MEQRIYHGSIKPQDISRAIILHFNRGNWVVQQYGQGDRIGVQIATSRGPVSGGQTALGIQIYSVEDGVAVEVGQQAWVGIALSVGMTALSALRNPFSLLGRLDDIAQDYENITLTEEVWRVIDRTARAMGAGLSLSDRLRRVVCEYCGTGNPVGEGSCVACGAPLGHSQPGTCRNCGYVITDADRICPNCQAVLKA